MNNVAYSSLDEAFSGPLNPPPPGKKQRKHKKDNDRETTAYGPGPLEGSPDPDRLEEQGRPLPIPEPMHGPSGPASSHPNRKQGMGAPVEATMSAAHANFFPLPGTTANTEEWEKAFMLEPTQNAMSFTPARTTTQNMGASVGWQNNGWRRPVDGKNTLWRSIPEAAAPPEYATAPGSLQQRLDDLTKKLDSLTGTSTPMNGTAELFLFVAIGLLLLLAIDTLLRFAASLASRKQTGGSRMRVRSGLGRRFR